MFERVQFQRSTIGERLAAHGGVGPGFDALRVILSVAILLGHAKIIAGAASSIQHTADGAVILTGVTRPFKVALVPVFFALSGFLVTGSALRLADLKRFFEARALRIFPALAVEVTLSALVLGPLFTTWALKDYFTAPGFFRYFGNVLGFVDFYLPGVFEGNPHSEVNLNLWTLPAEFYCYLILGAALLTGVLAKERLYLGLVFGLLGLGLILSLVTGFCVTPGIYPTPVVVLYFLVGSSFYILRQRLPASWPLFFISALAAYLTLLLPQAIFLSPVFVVYCTVFLGTDTLLRWEALKRRDYSYGIYLYGFPISQALLSVFPVFRANPYPFMLLALACSTGFAAASWTFIEKPLLRLKRSPKARSLAP